MVFVQQSRPLSVALESILKPRVGFDVILASAFYPLVPYAGPEGADLDTVAAVRNI